MKRRVWCKLRKELAMDRFSLTDAQWEKMGPFCFGKPTDPGRTGGDNRLFVEAVLWIARTGSPWRDLLPGHRHDTVGVAPLIQGVDLDALLADKAFDANWIVDELDERGAKIVISQMLQRKAPLDIDREVYKWRHLIDIDQSWRLSRVKGWVV
jgi:transposase